MRDKRPKAATGSPYQDAPIEKRRAYLHKLENPYATHAILDPDARVVVEVQPAIIAPISKVDFQKRCKMIFAQYMPAIEAGKLRDNYRAFIMRNENSPASRRGRLLAALAAYDLSEMGLVEAQFNREREPLTAKKLADIEKAADTEE